MSRSGRLAVLGAALRTRRLVAPAVVVALVAAISVAGPVLSPSIAQAAQVGCTADAGYTLCEEFTYSGADQTVTVPAGYDPANVKVKLWGAGGGGIDYQQMNGGAGGFTTGVLNLTGNTTATVIVGGGGQSACWNSGEVRGSLTSSYGGGGTSVPQPTGLMDDYFCGASGGGRTAVRVGTGITNTSAASEVLTAGGGGGTSDGTTGVNELGGGGGGTAGAAGTCPGPDPTFCQAGPGGGGTQTAGGVAGNFAHWGAAGPFSTAPTAGTQFQGGNGGCGDSKPGTECGGGGGGGYFGGGGGGEQVNPTDSPGGGGSGHIDTSVVSGGASTAATTFTPPGTAQTQYVAGVGAGGGTGATNVGSGDDTPRPGGDGLAVFEFAKLPTLTIAKTTLGAVGPFNFTGTNGIAATAITTVTAGVTVVSAPQTLTKGSTATSITEAAVANWQLTTATCTGMGTGGTATLNAATRTLSLNAAATVDASNIVCTFVNAKIPIVQVAKTLADPTGTGNTFGFGLTGVTPTTDSIVGVAGTTVISPVLHPGSIGTPVVVTESSTTGLPLADYTTSMSCVDATGGNATITSATTAVTIPAANMSPNANWTCTATNTRKSTTLQVAKKWSANSIAGNTVTVTSSGFTNTATSGSSVATAAGNTTTGTAVTVYAGESGTIGEAFSVGSAANYTSTLACTSGLSGTTVTIASASGAIVCTETNTRKTATLKLVKTWVAGSTAGDTVTVTSSGFINSATSGASVATAAGNTTTGTAATVFAGESGTIGETFSVGSAANYAATVACTGNTIPLSGTTLTISPSDTAIVCTETNTPHAVTLNVVKIWAANSKAGDTVTVASSGFLSNASTGAVVATAAGNTTASTAVTVFAGNTGTIGETYSVGSAANYTTTLACTGNANPLVGNALTVSASDTAITCTETNTRKSAMLILVKTWAPNSEAGDTVAVTSSGFINTASSGTSVATAAGNSTTGPAVTVFAGESGTIGETYSVGSAANYVSTLTCTGTSGLSGSTLTVSPTDTAITCTETNTRKTATLTLVKTWAANSKPGDTVTVTSTGLTNNATSGSSVATAAGNSTTGMAVTVFAGESGTISETYSVGSATNYVSTLTCTGNANPLVGNALTVSASDTAITCTETNARRTATLTLVKTWAANSKPGDTVTVTSTGLTNNATSGASVATTAGNSTTGTAVSVFAGESATIGETYSVGSAANYTTTLACTGNANPLVGSALTVSASDAAITCTETNTRKSATLILVKTWAANSKPGDTVAVTSSGFTNTAASGTSVATVAGNSTTGPSVTVFAGESGTIGETYSVGSATNYTTTLACTGTSGLSGSTLTVSAADTAITCTETNTRKSATLILVKTWAANSKAGDTATVMSTGLTNNATSGISVATAAGNTTTGTAVTVFAGESGTIGETYSVGSAANYTTTLSCVGNANPLVANALTVSASDTAITCTETNTRKSATLTLVKTWAPGSTAGDTVAVTSSGFINPATSGASVATAAGNTTIGTAVTVFAGESGPIGETFAVGSSANYAATVTCTGNADPLSGATLTISPSDTAITCTETNTPHAATLNVIKVWSANSKAGDTVTVTSSGFTNPATSGSSVATTAGNMTTGTAVTVFAGESGTIGETYSVGSAANYTTTLSCVGNANPLVGNALTVSPADATITCTETNTRKSATLILVKTWAANSNPGDTVAVTNSGFINTASSGSSVATTAGNSTTGPAVTVFAAESGTIGETYSVGPAANYTTTLACTGNANPLVGGTLTVSPADAAITCTETNTRKSATLILVKTWAPGSAAGDTVAVTSSGLMNPATSGPSVATAAGNSTTGTAVTIFAGESGTIGETYTVGSATNYTTTLACTGNANPLIGNALTVSAADTAITCTETNTRKTATLTLVKTWVTGSAAGDTVTVTSSGFITSATSGPSVATAAGNSTTGTAVTVFAGESGLISETFAVGSAANYAATVACIGNATPLSGNTLTISSSDTAITCTETNTPHAATLNVVKVWSANSQPGDTVTVASSGFSIDASTGAVVASAAGNSTTGTAVTVFAGESGTIGETYSVGSAANYTTTLTCTGNANPLVGGTLTVSPADAAITCTETNTRKSATLILVKTWAANSKPGDTVAVTSSGFINTASSGTSVATTAGNSTTGPAVTVFAAESGTIGETYSVGSAANYTTTLACTGNANPLVGNALTVSASDTSIICTETNTRTSATLILVKTWAANSEAGDTVTVMSTSLTNNATSGPSVATTAGNTTTGTAVTVFAGESGTIGEAYSVGSAANYVSTLVCTGNANPLVGNALTVSASDTAITCTETNTRKSPTLILVKTWAANSEAGDTVTVTSTGLTNIATSGSSVATTAGNSTTGTAVTIFAGEAGTIGETYSVGSAANYVSTLTCTGTSGLSGSTLTVNAADTAITCIETNTRKSATLTLVKMWGAGSNPGDTVTVDSAALTVNATSGTSVATLAGNSTTGAAITAFAGDSGPITETFSAGSAANYISTLACAGNSVPLSGNTLTIAATDVGASIVCTETNLATPANLTVSKSATPATGSTVLPGQTVTYTLNFVNTGDGTATADYVDTLTGPATQTSNPVAAAGLVVAASTANPFTVTGTVAPHTTSTVTYTAMVDVGATGVILNFVLDPGVTPPATCVPSDPTCTQNPVPSLDPALNTVKVLSQVNGVTATANQVVFPSDVLIYTITTTNTGSAVGVTTVGDTTPNETTYTGVGEGWTFSGSAATQQVTVAVGASESVTFTVTVDALITTNATITNVATSTGGTCSACTVHNPGPPPVVTTLAFTGVSNLQRNLIVVALLIGAGGALLLVAEKRRRRAN